MPSMSVSLPSQMRGFIKSRLEAGEYHNESEYIRDLIRQDQKRLAHEEALLKMIREGDASGISDRNVLDIMEDVKARLRADGKI